MPAPAEEIANLSVSPGDVVSVTVSSPTLQETWFYFINVTSGVGTTFAKPLPSVVKGGESADLVGGTAEWIVERPTDASTNVPVELAGFASVYFDGCVAGLRDGTLIDLVPATEVRMMIDYYIRADPWVLTETVFRVDEEGTGQGFEVVERDR